MNLGTYSIARDIERDEYETRLWYGLGIDETPDEAYDRARELAERRHLHDFDHLPQPSWSDAQDDPALAWTATPVLPPGVLPVPSPPDMTGGAGRTRHAREAA